MNTMRQNPSNQMKKRLNLWMVVALGLLISNVLLAYLCWYSLYHQKVEVTPFFGNQGYTKSDSSVDVHYLNQLSENFINARLNVSPNNIKTNHQRLLSYVDSRLYHDFSLGLLREQKHIIDKKISSYFDIETLQSNPEKLTTDVTGTLRRFVGLRELAPEKLHYQLRYRYQLGRITIMGFEKVGGHKNA